MNSAIYHVIYKACEKAGRALLRDFGEVENLQVSIKGPADFVSKADKNSERIIVQSLTRDRPEYGIITEEAGEINFAPKEEPYFIIDPLDGTTNFLHGLGHFAISIGFAEQDKLIAAMVHDPIRGEYFYAEDKKGAFLNGRKIKTAKRNIPELGLFATGIPFKKHDDEYRIKFTRQLNRFMEKTSGVRRFGAASLDLAYIAAGRYDGYWENDLQVWDIAAGILLVREAGGVVTDFKGRSITHWQAQEILACNFDFHNFMQDQLA